MNNYNENDLNNNKEKDRRDLLVKVAKMYYIDNLTQQEIADRIFLSRSNISHLLKKCVEQKIVEFRVNELSSKDEDLQIEIKKQYSLQDIIIVPTAQDLDETKRRLGEAISTYLETKLKNGMLLGITWGTTMYNIVKSFKPISNISVDVIQMVGGIESDSPSTNNRYITTTLAKLLNGQAMVPNVPYIVKSSKLKDMLLLEPSIIDYFKRVSKVDIALVGLGTARKSLNLSKLQHSGYFTDKDIDLLESEGAVADIAGIQFNAEGERCAQDISKRIIGISYEVLAQIPMIIGAAVGVEKTDVIAAALSSGLISVLVTDESAAISLLNKSH